MSHPRQPYQQQQTAWSNGAALPPPPAYPSASLWQAQQAHQQLQQHPHGQHHPSAWTHPHPGVMAHGQPQAPVIVSPRTMLTAADLLEAPSSQADSFTWQQLHQQPQQHSPKPAVTSYTLPQSMEAAGQPEVTSRFFTQRVAAGPPSPRQQQQLQLSLAQPRRSPPQAQQAPVPLSPQHLRPLLFSSQALFKLRPLLQFGQQPSGTSRAPFPPPPIGLAQHFTLRQSASIAADIVVTGARSIALLIINDKEMQQAEQRKKFLQRCEQLQRQQRYLYIIHLQEPVDKKDDTPRVDYVEQLRGSHSLPPLLRCSSLAFAVDCIAALSKGISSGGATTKSPSGAAQTTSPIIKRSPTASSPSAPTECIAAGAIRR